MAEPTSREFDRWVASIDRLTETIEQLPGQLREEMARDYVRKEVHAEQIAGLKKLGFVATQLALTYEKDGYVEVMLFDPHLYEE